jgi:hypothetical protein
MTYQATISKAAKLINRAGDDMTMRQSRAYFNAILAILEACQVVDVPADAQTRMDYIRLCLSRIAGSLQTKYQF